MGREEDIAGDLSFRSDRLNEIIRSVVQSMHVDHRRETVVYRV